MRLAASSSLATSRPFSSATRSFKAAAKSISPFMARAVMPAIFSRRPKNSASSSSISFSIMVDSMSATSSFLRRPAAGTTTASIAVMATGLALAVERHVAGDLRRQPLGRADRGALRLQHGDGVR